MDRRIVREKTGSGLITFSGQQSALGRGSSGTLQAAGGVPDFENAGALQRHPAHYGRAFLTHPTQLNIILITISVFICQVIFYLINLILFYELRSFYGRKTHHAGLTQQKIPLKIDDKPYIRSTCDFDCRSGTCRGPLLKTIIVAEPRRQPPRAAPSRNHKAAADVCTLNLNPYTGRSLIKLPLNKAHKPGLSASTQGPHVPSPTTYRWNNTLCDPGIFLRKRSL